MFSWYDGTLKASDAYLGRINLLGNSYGFGKASVNLSSIRESGKLIIAYLSDISVLSISLQIPVGTNAKYYSQIERQV